MALVKPDSARIAKIKVIGIGGGGGNAISSMIESNDIAGVAEGISVGEID